jgi:FKBP12-rapamycin complex-associated protein
MATPSVSQQTDILNSIFLGLKSKVPETRLQSALDLRRYVCLLHPDDVLVPNRPP